MSNILSEVHPELVAEWSDKNLPLTPDRITYGSNKVVWWKGACGHEWQTSVKARSNGENCPICSGARVIEGINDLATLKPELADEWSSKNDPLKPTMVTTGSHKKVIWQDKYGHEWTATVKSRALNGTGCPYCSHNKILVGFNDLASQRPQIASEWSERNYPLKPDMVTVFANRKVWWRCSKGHEWNTLISTRSGGSGCPYCSGQLLLKGFNDFATTHPQLAQEWSDRNLPFTPDMINEKSRRNVWWKCRECGYEWQSVVYARVKGTVFMPIGMLVVLDSILNRITQNRAKGRNTFIFIDEIYLLFQHEYSANFLFTLWKRVRKYGAYATGITQNVDDLLQSHTARTMLANSEFIIMLNQASTDRLELAKLLNISDLQMSYITNVEAGHGLIKVGSSLVPFANKFPKNTKLYKLMTTKPGESA